MKAKRILVVEDDTDFAEMVVSWLRRAGHSVTIVQTGKEGLRCLEERVFDILLTDIILPDYDGFELISHIRQRFFGVGIIAMSGGGILPASTYVRIAAELGASKVLMKPFSQDELLLALNVST